MSIGGRKMRDSIILYRSLREATKQLDLETRAKVYDAIMDYAFDGTEPQESGIVQAMFLMMKPIIDTNNQRFENGCKGGRPKNQTITKTKPNENQNETKPEPNKDKDKDVDKDKEEKERVKEKVAIARFTKPTLEEIKSYCQSANIVIDCQAFMDFYESKGWRVGNQPMKDWKAAVRNWARRDRQPAKQYDQQEQTESIDDIIQRMKREAQYERAI